MNIRRTKYRFLACALTLAFVMSDVGVYAQGIVQLPAPGTRMALSSAFTPAMLKGIKVYRNDPFRFDFILDKGDGNQPLPNRGHVAPFVNVSPGTLPSELAMDTKATQGADRMPSELEIKRLIKYFLAALTIPEKDLWVNLSPYEKDRIVPEAFGQTEMGRDLLAQDYLLKQITASVIYPDEKVGKEFWDKVYAESLRKYGTTDVPVDTFNKVWIMPEKARIYENKDAAFVVEGRLKVMLESDYLSMENNQRPTRGHVAPSVNVSPGTLPSELAMDTKATTQDMAKNILREVVIPILEKEVNEGKNFEQLRQVYNSLILATWYKRKVKASIMGQAYVDQRKISGIGYAMPTRVSSVIQTNLGPEQIWSKYVEAFNKGAFDLIREERDPATMEPVPRKYFSGGVDASQLQLEVIDDGSVLPQVDARDVVIEMQGNLTPLDPVQSKEAFSSAVLNSSIIKLIETSSRPKVLRQDQIEGDQLPHLMEWFLSQRLMPSATLLKQLIYNVHFQYTQGDKRVANDWLLLMAQKWDIKKETLDRLMFWFRKNKTFDTEVSEGNIYAFMQAVVASYRQFHNLRTTFVYNLPPSLSGDEQLALATANINRMTGISDRNFVGNKTLLKAPIKGTPYFISFQYGLAEDTHGLYLALGREQNAREPLAGIFFRIGLDSQENALRVIMVQGLHGAEKEINETFPGMLGFHPGVALLYVAAALAEQGHLNYNNDGFENVQKVPFDRLSGVRPGFIPTMRNGTPSIEIMINYERFGLRRATDFDRWQNTSYLTEKLIPTRVAMGGVKGKGILAMTDAFHQLKPVMVNAVNMKEGVDGQSFSSDAPIDGGIDLDPTQMDVITQSSAEAVKFDIDPKILQQLQSSSGITPVVVGIHSLDSLRQFLGLIQ
ncbi:MAG: hypothetical protein HQL17_07230 [Candidatus Omnitrophica bacterium]|nr:hypothetical protein [Candidatus Omnitrophota bacterium]